MRNSFKSKWLVLMMVMVLLSAFAVGCGTQETPQPADQPKEVTPVVSMADVADQYYAQMPENMYKIDSKELKERLDAKDATLFVLDIQKTEDYAKGHIQGAVNIPFKALSTMLDKLPADKEIAVNCYTGQTSGQAVAILNMYGYNARSLHLGYVKGWVGDNNFPVDTVAVELPANVTPAKPDPAIAKILTDYLANMPENHRVITSEEVQAMIEKGDDIQIVDIRSAEDFAAGHIKGAIHVPFKEVNKNFDKFAKDKPVFVVCVTGQTAGQTIAVLNTLGIDAQSIKSGMKLGWIPAGLPLEK